MSKPIVLFSSIEHPAHSGDDRYNGGYKLHAIWCKLLREHGYEAYRVTQDGSQLDWLMDPPAVLSYSQAYTLGHSGHPVRVMTTWIVAEMALQLAERPYFFDAEIAHTVSGAHIGALRRWWDQLAKVGTHSRTQQAWYMATFGYTPQLIQEWSDPTIFSPCPEQRIARRIGYMHEGPHTEQHITHIQQRLAAAGESAEFYMVRGSEQEVRDGMRSCDVFLGMNAGKHPLWGEGCPRSANESQHTGCVVIAYHVMGNLEYIIDGYTGFLVKRANPDAMADKLIQVLRDATLRESVRARGVDFALHQFSGGPAKWAEIREFLDL